MLVNCSQYVVHFKRDCRAMLEERSKRIINVEESISAQLAFQMVRLLTSGMHAMS